MRRDREQVLRQAVVDLACDTGALLRDRAPELGVTDRPPDTDEQHAVGEEPEEVALHELLRRDVG